MSSTPPPPASLPDETGRSEVDDDDLLPHPGGVPSTDGSELGESGEDNNEIVTTTTTSSPSGSSSGNISESSSSSSSSSSSGGSTRKKKSKSNSNNDKPRQLLLKMLNLCKEFTLMSLVLLVYVAFTNESPPKIGKSPAAYPFFAEDSPVVDWYRGEITEAIERARASDIAFVMFYAPWDAESRRARGEFETAARAMGEWVAFAAINCWQPGSECKSQYSKVYKWPVLIAYPTHGRGIQYGGPLDAPHMIRFLRNICRPLAAPQNVNDLISKHDAVVLGNINVLPGSLEYAVFYLTALRFLERDPFREVQFAVVPQSVHSDGGPRIHLYLWNETIVYDGEWNPESVLSWIYKRLHQIAGWISPSGTKSLSLSNYVQPGPALIVFTPKNPFNDQVDYYSLLKEIAYDYYNCANNDIISLKRRLIHMERLKNFVKHRDLKRKCQLNDAEHRTHQKFNKNIITHVPKIWANISVSRSSSSSSGGAKTCDDSCASCGELECYDFDRNTVEKFCGDYRHRAPPGGTHYKTSMWTGRDDPRSPERLRLAADEDECATWRSSRDHEPTVFAERDPNAAEDVKGLACIHNESLSLIAMDSLRYYHFAEKLGIDLSKTKDKTAVVIINEKLETHHVMEGKLTDSKLKSFIKNFTDGFLSRALHSNPQIASRKTHVYSDLTCAKYSNKNEIGDSSVFCVEELNSENFLQTIMRPNKAVVVFYYSKQCSFCNGIAYAFLTVAKMLAAVGNVDFARVDGDLNMLPWAYTMESYPTVLFVPSKRKSESRVFPMSIPMTVPNLVGFILTNLEPGLKLEAMWAICNKTKFELEREKCVTSVRAETLAVINSVLREWRTVSTRRKALVLHKLQLLRHLQLQFAHSPREVAAVQGYFARLRGPTTGVGASSTTKDEL